MNAPVSTQKIVGCWCKGACPHIARVQAIEQKRGQRRAEIALRHVLAASPDCMEARRHLARIMAMDNRAAFADAHLNAAMRIAGETPDLLVQRAFLLRNETRVYEAIQAGARAVDAAPENPFAYQALAGALEHAGQLEAAYDVCVRARSRFGAAKDMRRITAVLLDGMGRTEEAIAALGGDDLIPLELFDRGRFFEKLGRYGDAWRDWMQGKQIQREQQGCVYDAAAAERRFAELFDIAQPSRWRYVKGVQQEDGRDGVRPIFITGFPRSGTTMLEASISSHSRVVAGDELMTLSEVVTLMPLLFAGGVPYPRAMLASSFGENRVALELLANYYVDKSFAKIRITNAAGVERKWLARYFTDKMPSNELHWPLIDMLLPEAPIVHLQRHPLDVIVSNMSQNLTHGAYISCALESCASNLARTAELTDHYRRSIKGLLLHVVHYESFVAQLAGEVGMLLDFLNLEREQACIDFHENPWQSRTISYRQIKTPANTKSVGRYKPFLQFLEPILPIVRPMMQRQGYEL